MGAIGHAGSVARGQKLDEALRAGGCHEYFMREQRLSHFGKHRIQRRTWYRLLIALHVFCMPASGAATILVTSLFERMDNRAELRRGENTADAQKHQAISPRVPQSRSALRLHKSRSHRP